MVNGPSSAEPFAEQWNESLGVFLLLFSGIISPVCDHIFSGWRKGRSWNTITTAGVVEGIMRWGEGISWRRWEEPRS